MRKIRWLTPFIFAMAALFLFSACGTSLEKPTGLEEIEDKQIEIEPTTKQVDGYLGIISSSYFTAEHSIDLKTPEEEAARKEAETEDDNVEQEPTTETAEKENSSTEHEVTNKKSDSGTSSTKDPYEKETKSSSASTKPSSSTKEQEQSTDTAKDSPKEQDDTEEKPAPDKPKAEEPKNTISISVVISESEVPLPPTELEIVDGDSVLDALIDITMSQSVHLDYRGGRGASAYVQGLGNVYEFDRGPGSGWMYRVNGIFPNRGAGVVPLLGGDRVEWLYTENLGEDLGADLQPFR